MAAFEPTSNYSYHILQSLKSNPDKTLLVIGNECVTGRQFHEKVTAAVQLFKWKEVAPNGRVLIVISPCVEFYVVCVATLIIGCSIVIVDPSIGLERVDHCIAVAKPSVWLWKKGSSLRFLKYLLPSLGAIPTGLEVGGLELPSVSSQELVEPSEAEVVDHALVTFTTGSTGMPKLMMRKHSFLLNQTQSMSLSYDMTVKAELGLEETESSMCTNLPVLILHYLKIGSLAVLDPSIAQCNPAETIKLLKKHSVTSILGSPAYVEKLAAYASKQKMNLPVVYSGVGGAPVFRGTLRTISSVTADRKTAVIYGSTEAEPICHIFAAEKLQLEEGQPEGHCVGRPVFKGSVKIIEIQTKDPPVNAVDLERDFQKPSGEIGEIVVSGWHVNTYQVEPKRLLTDVDGTVWLRTEDAGYMDSEGRVWLVGRVKWRVVAASGKTHWSTVIEQKILDRCSKVTFAAYLPHKGAAWLFLEAPNGLPDNEKAGIRSFLAREDIPVDHFEIRKHITRDRRHASKPNTAALFRSSNPNSPVVMLKMALKTNPMIAVAIVFVQIVLILCVVALIARS